MMANIGSHNSRALSFLMLRRFRFWLSAQDEAIPLVLDRLFEIVDIFPKNGLLFSKLRSGAGSKLNQDRASNSVRRGDDLIASIKSASRAERAALCLKPWLGWRTCPHPPKLSRTTRVPARDASRVLIETRIESS
jgi:hypothetical protein